MQLQEFKCNKIQSIQPLALVNKSTFFTHTKVKILLTSQKTKWKLFYLQMNCLYPQGDWLNGYIYSILKINPPTLSNRKARKVNTNNSSLKMKHVVMISSKNCLRCDLKCAVSHTHTWSFINYRLVTAKQKWLFIILTFYVFHKFPSISSEEFNPLSTAISVL